MTADLTTLEAARTALASEAAVDPQHHDIDLAFADDALTVTGEVASVAAKKIALEALAAVPGVIGIVDRLHVAPAQRMGDGEIRTLVRDAFLQEPALAELTLTEIIKGQEELVREPPLGSRGSVEIDVQDGVVTLNGEVPGLGHKRLAGVLAWWVPGSRDVINGIAVNPDERDDDNEITDAVRVALEKDPFVNAGQIRVATNEAVVTLDGIVPSESEREMAEADAWYVFAVDKVVNRIEVKA